MAEATKPAKAALEDKIFNVVVSDHSLIKQAYDTYLSNARSAKASTKTRGEVRGGGKKPWRQKGTGRARAGSIRSPIWRKGGIIFGPTGAENYKKHLSKTAKRLAVRQALSLANQAKKISVAEIKLSGKTKDAVSLIADSSVSNRQKLLIVVDQKDSAIMRSTSNLQNVLVVSAMYLNVYHILNADKIIASPKAIEVIKSWLGEGEVS